MKKHSGGFWVGMLCVYVVVYAAAGIWLVLAGAAVGAVWGMVALAVGAWNGVRVPDRRLHAPLGDPALASYPVVQSWQDLNLLADGAKSQLEATTQAIWRAHAKRSESAPWAIPLFVPHGLGLALGFVGATLIWAAVLLGGVAIAAVAWLVAAAISIALQGADKVAALKRRVKIVCPNAVCTREVSYPGYRCARCQQLHRSPRDWRGGVLRRRCTCGARLRPLVILGAAAQDGACPHCGGPLDRSAGTVRDVVVPFIGASGSGKTTLVAAVWHDLASDVAYHAVPAESSTQRLATLDAALVAGTPMAPTPSEATNAIEILATHTTAGAIDLQLHDVAGDLYATESTVDQLRSLLTAEHFVIVVDPLTLPDVREHLIAEELVGTTAVPDLLSVHSMTLVRLGDVERRGRAAVVVAKADRIATVELGRTLVSAVEFDDVAGWLESLGQGSFNRAVRSTFSDVAFFACAGSAQPAPGFDRPLAPIAWLLEVEERTPRSARLAPIRRTSEAALPPPPTPGASGGHGSASEGVADHRSVASAATPACVVVVVDRSSESASSSGPSERPVAAAVDEILLELLLIAEGSEARRDAIDVAVVDRGSRPEPVLAGALRAHEQFSAAELRSAAQWLTDTELPSGSTMAAVQVPRWCEGSDPLLPGDAPAASERIQAIVDGVRLRHPQRPAPVVVEVGTAHSAWCSPPELAGGATILRVVADDGGTSLRSTILALADAMEIR